MVYKFSMSVKHCVNIPQLNWWLMYKILHTARPSFFSCGLVFCMNVVSVVVYADDPVASSPL